MSIKRDVALLIVEVPNRAQAYFATLTVVALCSQKTGHKKQVVAEPSEVQFSHHSMFQGQVIKAFGIYKP